MNSTKRSVPKDYSAPINSTCVAAALMARARLIIECKDIGKEKKVDQDVLLKLVAVQDRLGAEHSAVITTSAFTRGARQVAVDHDVTLIRLRPYEPTKDDGTWIRAVDVELRMGFVIQSDIELLTDAGVVSAKEARAPAEAWMDVRDVNGIASATVGDLFAQGVVLSQAEGITKKEVILKSRWSSNPRPGGSSSTGSAGPRRLSGRRRTSAGRRRVSRDSSSNSSTRTASHSMAR